MLFMHKEDYMIEANEEVQRSLQQPKEIEFIHFKD